MWLLLLIALLAWLVLGTWGLVRHVGRPPAGAIGAALAHGLPTDPGEAGCTWTDDVLHTHDGFDLPLWRIDGGDPDGPTVIDLHDWGASPVTQLDVVADTASTARALVLPTLRGHARNTGRCSLGPREAADLRTLLASVEGDVVLRGTGLGGLVAEACRDAPGVVDVHVHEPWTDQRDGLRRILARRGQVAFPFAWLAKLCLP